MLRHITLKNFRNHKDFTTNLSKTTVIIGQNGIGKSNILESIALVSHCRSFREEDKKNLVHQEHDYARVTIDDLEVFIQKNPQLLFQAKNKGVVKKQSDFIGTVKSVVFSPESLDIILGSPKNRRRFLDLMISQKDREYLKNLIQYEKVRKERNSLLLLIADNRAKEDELDFWDMKLSSLGKLILNRRTEAIVMLNDIVGELYKKISDDPRDVFLIQYLSGADEDFEKQLFNNRRRDIIMRQTISGPHRADLVFLLNSNNIKNYGSRGEIRTGVISLKIAELEFLTEKIDNKEDDLPVLLLDDVFSEFDDKRRKALCQTIILYQTVITTTDRDHLTDEILKGCQIIKL